MTRSVLDTNALASGFAGGERVTSTPGRLLGEWRARRFELVVSHHLLTELERTFQNPYFRRQMTALQINAALDLLRVDATFVSITVSVQGVATHPEDDLVLATAVSAGADYLVTGDKQLQRLGANAGVAILSPRAFLDLLDQRADP